MAACSNDHCYPLTLECNGLMVTIDPRIELLNIVQRFAGSKMVRNDGCGYSDSVDEWFEPYAAHPVVEMMKELEEREFDHDAPVHFMLLYDGVPLEKKSFRYEQHIAESQEIRLQYIGEKEEFQTWIELMNDFAQQSRFAEFFKGQASFYRTQLDKVGMKLAGMKIVEAITDWYGYRSGDFTIIIAPLSRMGGYGPCVVDGDDNQHNFCIVGSVDLITLVHEFSHSYINPLVMDSYEEVQKTEVLCNEQVLKRMYACYNQWWVIVIEHFVRIAVIRILRRLEDKFRIEVALENEERQGFLYIRFLNERCEEYERSGETFKAYYPRFVKALQDLAESPDEYLSTFRDFSMVGPINRISDNLYCIYPDPALTHGVEDNILTVVEFMLERLGGKAITDLEAMDMDMSGHNLIVFGPGNRWLDQFADKFPFEMQPDRLVADRTYMGDNLRIVCCLPNPYNEDKGMVIYTAQSIEDMHSCNRFMHGPEDYVITDATCKILSNGNFVKTDGAWRFPSYDDINNQVY